MANLEEYRKIAKECRALAENVQTDYERKLLIEMARDWICLAKECELQSLNESGFSHGRGQGAAKGPDVV